jgi:hypothetical protein
LLFSFTAVFAQESADVEMADQLRQWQNIRCSVSHFAIVFIGLAIYFSR